ncbi:protein MODIFYING WALL LIGNIN-1-like [Corylus avellana]|uniref:protein MODIFYING WALL LIGNIN-1-like n=1 Tax=Corylus avellana TaxID=13451 RepID=UPI00286C8885|nr:protein MODIFYING WALL LIGNIN-1-like [Corylus avellana]
MDGRVVVTCTVVGLLGLLSAAAGFAAEATRITRSQVYDCALYPESPAVALGLIAALSLMIAQIIITVSTGCICCCQRRFQFPSDKNTRLARVSWSLFVIAFVLLVVGAVFNDQNTEENMYLSNGKCYVVKPGVFAGGALLSLVCVTLGIISYVTLTSAKNSNNPPAGNPNEGEIAIGQPQFPPQRTQQPV